MSNRESPESIASISEIRGRIIDTFVLIESDLNHIIVKHFNPRNDVDGFRKVLLNSSVLAFGSKVKLLFSLDIISSTLKEQLHTLGNIRNAFAHLSVKRSVSILVNDQLGTTEVDSKATIEVLQNNGKLIERDAYSWALEFTKIEKATRGELGRLMK